MKKRFAFTMLELLFVIVIMGILGKFGVEFLARAYDNFLFAKINDDLQSRSASSVEFITKRLENRIKKSASAFDPTTNTRTYIMGGVDVNATVLEWIAAEDDGFRGIQAPIWSGVIDLNLSNGTRLISPGSNFNDLDALIRVLSNNNSDINDSAIYFIDAVFTSTNEWGYDNNPITDQVHALHPVVEVNSTTLASPAAPTNVDTFSGKEVSEYYKLSWTANAVSLEDYNNTTNMGNLYFYYDYQPWQGETYLANGKKVLLAQGVNTFRFRSAGSLIKIQVCAKSRLTEEYALCKEKTVF